MQGAIVWHQKIGPVGKYREEEPLDDLVGKEGVKAPTGGGEAPYEGEGTLCQGEVVVEVVRGVECGGQPVAGPCDYPCR